ncbi:MAG: hypothetical protein IPL25_13020 [Saprospiraceae bacterium]|nr:hypothetical protein [Candidatus Vicinibacter affinis]
MTRNNSNIGLGKDCNIQSFDNSLHGGVYTSVVENAELPSLKLQIIPMIHLCMYTPNRL